MPERINQNMVKLPQKNQMYNMTHKIFTSCHTKKQTTNVRRFQEIIESFFQSFKGQLLTSSKCPFKSPKYGDVKNVAHLASSYCPLDLLQLDYYSVLPVVLNQGVTETSRVDANF